jgi:flagellar protein FliS
MNPYYEQKILSSDPIELVRLVYQRAISSIIEAREHLRHKRIAERSAAIMRAYEAIHQLLAALRPEVAPELCARLEGLYLYMQRRLLDANMRQIDPPLAEALSLLKTLVEAWAGVAEQLASPGAHSGEEEVISEKEMLVSNYASA